ncbi:MAG: squalene/phytoene synthase family protein [Proteobacteria bacterium]|nr:squalene/phytoene synthase family protein [Pseudomonadota bacterium]
MTGSQSNQEMPKLDTLPDDALQAELLEGVSRTFALTIPQLPEGLAKPVSNAYLLCRIVDTIEDEVALSSEQKRKFCQQFIAVVSGEADPGTLASELAPSLSTQTIPAEHELIRLIPRVIAITHGFDAPQREALTLCVRIMGKGMAEFQDRDLRHGLATMAEMSDYCYYVAGVVGEMLTRLFCHYSPEIAVHRDTLMRLAVSFGQGLQMTNILKDLWDDHGRGVCWLPRDIFEAHGFDLADLRPGHNDPRFCAGFSQLIGIAHGHLRNALEYTMLIPGHETGLREFCLWALGMAVLTLRKINQNINFSASAQVKISRRSVKGTILISRLTRRSNLLLKTAFYLAGSGLPEPDPQVLTLAKTDGPLRTHTSHLKRN